MKKSARYHKLWRSKLNELPVKEDADSAWSGMKELLDLHMPAGNPSNGPSSSPGKGINFLLTYIVPVMVVISLIVYFSSDPLKRPEKTRNNKVKTLQDSQRRLHGPDSSFSGAATGKPTTEILQKKQQAPGGRHSKSYFSGITAVPAALYQQQYFLNKRVDLNSPTVLFEPAAIAAFREPPALPYTGQSTHFTERGPAGQLPVMVFSAPGFINRIFENNGKTVGSDKRKKARKAAAPDHDAQNTPDTRLKSSAADSQEINPAPGIETGNADNFVSLSFFNRLKQKLRAISSGKIAGRKSDDTKADKVLKAKDDKKPLPLPYGYGLEAGMNAAGGGRSLYLGMFRSFTINKRWLVNAGLRYNSKRQLEGEYSHPSYYRPDSLPPFTVMDVRKIRVLDMPLNLEYRASRTISLQAGPTLSLLLKQSDKNGRLAPVADPRDTVFHSKDIKSAINGASVNKLAVGFNAGIGFHLKQFELSGKYQILTPYKVSGGLGSYRKQYSAFQIGLTYRFK